MHPHADGSGLGADDRADRVERETCSVAKREQVLLIRFEETDHGVQLDRPLAGEELLLDVGLGTYAFEPEQLHLWPALNVTHRVPRYLEQPAREAALTAKAPELR